MLLLALLPIACANSIANTFLKEIVHLQKKNVVINFDITVFHCVIKNKHLPSLFCFILLHSLVLSKR